MRIVMAISPSDDPASGTAVPRAIRGKNQFVEKANRVCARPPASGEPGRASDRSGRASSDGATRLPISPGMASSATRLRAALRHETDEGGSYCVDWFGGGTDGVGLVLLTHMHADHVSGLFDAAGAPARAWARRAGPRIVCSEQTKVLLVARGVPSCRVEALPLLEPCAVLVAGAAGSRSGPTVTLIDANHCPGSVMFHVQWDDINNLHTGDFRYSAQLHSSDEVLEQIRDVSRVFLDTTFYDESWDKEVNRGQKFPPKDESIQRLIALIREQNPEGHRPVYIAADSYGQVCEAGRERVCRSARWQCAHVLLGRLPRRRSSLSCTHRHVFPLLSFSLRSLSLSLTPSVCLSLFSLSRSRYCTQ
jgi:hypothetical protein